MTTTTLVIADVEILQDAQGRYDFSPLYKSTNPSQHGFIGILEELIGCRRPEKPKQLTVLYLILCAKTRTIKIGVAQNVKKRTTALQRAHGLPLKILYTAFSSDSMKNEKRLHAYWSHYRLKGEWFELPEAMTPKEFVSHSVAYLMTTTDPGVPDQRQRRRHP